MAAALVLTLSPRLSAHPGGGIVALSGSSAIFADPVENVVWLAEKDQKAKPLVSRFHGHWLTRGLDGNHYTEAFQESGGAWSSAAFRLELPGGKLTEVAHRDDLGVLAFAADRDGSLVFQRRGSLVSRKDGKERPFRGLAAELDLKDVAAYAWSPAGDLVLADRNRILRIDPRGGVTLVARIEGKVLEPRIWNATDVPSIFGLAVDRAGRVLAAVPDLDRVYRIERGREPQGIAGGEGGWRATGVAVFEDSIFLLESDSRASTSPRFRILRPGGAVDVLTLPQRSE